MATGTSADGTEFTVRIDLDPSDLAAITRQVSSAFTGAFDISQKVLTDFMRKMTAELNKGFARMQGPAGDVANEFHNMDSAAHKFNTHFAADAVKLLETLRSMNTAMQENVATINLAKETSRRSSVETTARQSDANRLAVEQIRAKSKANFAASQKDEILAKTTAAIQIEASKEASRQSLLDARISAQRRAQIHKQLYTQIRAIEKSLGTVIKTVYRDASAVAAKAFSGLSSIGQSIASHMRKDSTVVKTEMQEMTSSVQKNSKKMNTEFTEGVNSALNKRERLLRSSFTTQEQILTKSAIRQQAAMTKMRASVSTGVLGATTGRGVGMGIGALIGGVGIVAGLKAGFTAAVNMNEQINKTGVLFGESAKAVVAWSRNSVKELGATSDAALQAAGTFGNIFRGADIAEAPAAQMSVQMAKLAADLSSFNNVPIEDVFTALKAGLVGEMEPMRSLGIVLNDADLRQRSFLQGTSDGKSVLSASARAQAAYSLIMEKTTLAQGDYARTANEGANALRTAASAAKQFLMTALIPLVPIVSALAVGFTALFTGITKALVTTNPIIHEFRRAMMGAAVAMLAVIAAKGIIEVFKLTAAALKLVLTPMGTVLIAAGLLGAALVVMTDQSAPLRAALTQVGSKLTEIGKKIGGEVKPLFKELGDLINTYVVPAFQWLAQWLADHIVGAFDATVRFITDTLIPALQSAASWARDMVSLGWDAIVTFIHTKLIPAFNTFIAFMQDKVYPVLVDIGRWFQSAFDTAWTALKNFWTDVQPVLQPIIDGFATLGSAVRDAFSGDFSNLGDGAKAVASGFAETFKTVGSAIIDVLKEAWKNIKAWLKETFSGKNLTEFATGFLDLVERIGFILGNIATNPYFLAAVVAIGAAAAVVGIKFAEGVARGVLDNVPMIAKMLGGALLLALTEAVKWAFSNPAIILAVFLGFKALVGLKSAFASFQTAGKNAGDGFLAGFRKSIKTEAGAAAGFMHGLFGSPGSSVKKYYTDVNKAMKTETANLQRKIRAFGGTMIVDDRNLKEARKQVQLLTKDLNPAAQHGLLLRDSFRQAGIAAGGIRKGVGQVFGDLRQGAKATKDAFVRALNMTDQFTTLKGQTQVFGTSFKFFFKGLTSGLGGDMMLGLRGAFDSIKTFLASQGIVTGGQFAKAFVRAAGKGVVGLATVVGAAALGNAVGQSGGSALIPALLGGVAAAAMFEGAWAPVIGVLAAGATLIGAHFGEAAKKAKELREELKRLTGTFTDELVKAIESGAVALEGLNVKIDFSKMLDLGDLEKFTKESIGAKLSDAAVNALTTAGVSLNSVVDMMKQANGDADTFTRLFSDKMVNATTNTKAFGDAFGVAAPKVAGMMKDVVAAGGSVDDIIARLTRANIDGKNTDMINLLVKNKTLLDGIVRGAKGVTDEAALIFTSADAALKRAALLADEVTPKVLPKDASRAAREIADGMNIAASATAGAQLEARELWKTMVAGGISVENANKQLEKIGLPPVPTQDVEAWTAELDKIKVQADAINTALAAMPEKFGKAIAAAALATPGKETPTGSTDRNVIQAASVSSGVQDAIVKGVDTTVGSAQFNEAVRAVSDSIGTALAEGVADGTVVDPASAMTLVDTLHKAMLEGLDPNAPGFAESKAELDKIFANLPPLQPIIDEENALLQAQHMTDIFQKFLTDHPLSTDAQIKFWVGMGDTGVGVLNEGDMRRHGGAVPKGMSTDIIKNLLPTAAETQKQAAPTGAAVVKGLTAGMNDPDAIAAMKAQMKHLANLALAQFKLTAGISSPSRVMKGYGINMAEGLAAGINSGISTATTAAAKLAQSSLDAAQGVMSGGVQFGGASPSSFVGGFGRPSAGSTVGGSTTTTVNEGSSAPFVGQITIMETANAQQTARKVVTELRSEALLARRRP